MFKEGSKWATRVQQPVQKWKLAEGGLKMAAKNENSAEISYTEVPPV